ncbi:helix-turn-helix domain-containing protein [Limnoglobus roseus]|uniref:Adhesin n=1 Tax=Limnoglobus roseus TaxID=2598579 RepID=A0A5C1A6K3_9BACT|nr:adhesin [Limnoglobus roseus]QEL14811.1 adhesin [Limnoglobus roseus]
MTPAELRTLGNKHGRGWQARLARELPINARTIRRWLSGKTTMHPAIAKQVRHVMEGWLP